MRPGLLEHAHGGTLFLDEIADMPLTTQAKILRVLTDQSYHRVGGQRPVKVDVRVLSATSRNLQDEIAAGRFREDLYYRLNVVPVRLPPLRERREDIPELVNHFLARFAAERRMPPPRMSDEAMAALQAHDWPGNVRQLRNIIERTIILAPGDRVACIEVDLLPTEVLDNQNAMGGCDPAMAIMGSPLREARESFEREYLKIQIRRFSGNISRTASFIGMERSALHRKLKALGHRRQARRGGIGAGAQLWPLNRSACRIISSTASGAPSCRSRSSWSRASSSRASSPGSTLFRCCCGAKARRSWSTSIRSRPSCRPGRRRTSSLPAAGRRPQGALQDLFLAAAAREQRADDPVPGQRRDASGRGRGLRPVRLVLERGGQIQLVYKHAISTLQPAHALELEAEQDRRRGGG